MNFFRLLIALGTAKLLVLSTTAVAGGSGCGLQDGVAKEQRLSHRLHWETKTETLSAGFDILRSESMDGKFEKVNETPVPSARLSTIVRKYEYVDDTIDPCRMYYYYVEAIGEDGHREKVSPTIAAKSKLPTNVAK